MISETSVRAGARKLFEQHLYPIMAPHQQALFVPPAYGCNDTACANIAFTLETLLASNSPSTYSDTTIRPEDWYVRWPTGARTSLPRNVASVQFAFELMYVLSARRCANKLCCSNSTRDGPNPPCHGDCSLAMLQWAKFSYDWARDDHRIVVRTHIRK